MKQNDWEIREYNWSPDSKWIAFSENSNNSVNKIHIYGLDKGDIHQVTDNWYNAGSPAFGTEGKYLFFVSARDFNPTYSWTEWNHAYQDMNAVYFVTLQKDTPSPFEPENDEVEIKSNGEEKRCKGSREKRRIKSGNVIDFDGITDRVIKLTRECRKLLESESCKKFSLLCL